MAPLNWGLGHATRCIPIIRALLEHHFEPIIASDGVALALLQKEFPDLQHVELPSYKITYAKNGKNFKMKMLWDSPKMLKAIAKEKKETKKLVKKLGLDGIISDNRLGVRSKKVPSIFITHQLNVLTGNTTWMSTKVHQKIIEKYTQCWVPDVDGEPNLSGKLGHLKKPDAKVKYLGPLSRLEKLDLPQENDLMVLLSGPEPQRSLLEAKILKELIAFKGKVIFVRGKIQNEQEVEQRTIDGFSLTLYNFMTSAQLETALAQSKAVLCRSGYTTIMDLAKLGKKAFFIPTPGQYEQEYLAQLLQELELVPCCNQNEFTLEQLERIDGFKGLEDFGSAVDYSTLFGAFSKVKENSEPTSTSLST